MLVKEVMTPNAEGIQSKVSVLHAAQKMKELNTGILPVYDENDIQGVITDRDIVIRAVGEELNPSKTSVGEIMSKHVFFCNEYDSLADAAVRMEESKIRRLLVKDDSGLISGILSLGDIAVNSETALSGEILQGVSEPAEPKR
ncbi:MAG: CBS domain-containing protein [Fibrobacterota bacterium]